MVLMFRLMLYFPTINTTNPCLPDGCKIQAITVEHNAIKPSPRKKTHGIINVVNYGVDE